MPDHLKSEKPRGAVDKAFDLLRAFGEDSNTGVGVSELARRAGMSKSTAHRLLATLVDNSAVQKADEMYRLGPIFDNIRGPNPNVEGERVAELLTPFLAALFERTRQTVHLAYLVDTDVVYANKLFSVRSVGSPSRIGGRVPAYCTGVGKAIIAWDPDLIERAISRGLPQWTSHTITDPDDLRCVLEQVREDGVSYDHEEISEGLTCVAAPIFGRGRVPIAAMSVSGVVGEFNPADHKKTLLNVAAAAAKAYRRALHESE